VTLELKPKDKWAKEGKKIPPTPAGNLMSSRGYTLSSPPGGMDFLPET